MSVKDLVEQYKTECKKLILEPDPRSTLSISKLQHDIGRIFTQGTNEHNEYYELTNLIKDELFADRCIPYRWDLSEKTNITIRILMSQNNYLLDTVKELKGEIESLKTLISTKPEQSIIKELKKEVDTLKAVISGKGDVMNAVKVIQRYWRKFLLLKNIKRLAREYEAVLLREFRKSLTMKSPITNKNLLSAAESRVRPPSKASGSNPENWSVAKAATIASDWNS
tara:strand:- start:20 stop:694 length:675 start_codon:yes stop_codon:yes gene_type:complete